MGTYREIIIRGNDQVLRGFVWGFKGARKLDREIIFCRDEHINRHHVREILTFRTNYIHLLVDSEYRRPLLSAINQSHPFEFKVIADRKVRRAFFEFKFRVYSRKVAGRIKRLLDTVPDGLRKVQYKPKEHVNPKARGVEVYTPAHEYEFSGEGRIQGELSVLIGFHGKLEAHDHLHVKDIEIVSG